MTASGALGIHFRLVKSERICNDRLRYTKWVLDVSRPGFRNAALLQMAKAYVGLTGSWDYPDAALGVELPILDNVRKGDFGEIVAGALFSQRLGEEVPFQKLERMRPAANVTVQGPDVMAIAFTGEALKPIPSLVETKVRPSISPKEILADIAESLGRANDEYIGAAWRAAVRGMRAHPAKHKQFAFSAAEHLAQLTAKPGTHPEHNRQAVVVTARHTLTVDKIDEHWGNSPPVSELHVVEVPDLENLMVSS